MATVDRQATSDQRHATHEVFNQAAPLEPYNVFEADVPLKEALERENGGWGIDRVRDIGEVAGSVSRGSHSAASSGSRRSAGIAE